MITIKLKGDEKLLENCIYLFAKEIGWQEEINGEPNPISKDECVSNHISTYFKDMIAAGTARQYEEDKRDAMKKATESFSDIVISIE